LTQLFDFLKATMDTESFATMGIELGRHFGCISAVSGSGLYEFLDTITKPDMQNRCWKLLADKSDKMFTKFLQAAAGGANGDLLRYFVAPLLDKILIELVLSTNCTKALCSRPVKAGGLGVTIILQILCQWLVYEDSSECKCLSPLIQNYLLADTITRFGSNARFVESMQKGSSESKDSKVARRLFRVAFGDVPKAIAIDPHLKDFYDSVDKRLNTFLLHHLPKDLTGIVTSYSQITTLDFMDWYAGT
jgi:hypothetical protein